MRARTFKNLICIVLALVLAAVSLTGCAGRNKANGSSAEGTAQSQQAGTAAGTSDPGSAAPAGTGSQQGQVPGPQAGQTAEGQDGSGDSAPETDPGSMTVEEMLANKNKNPDAAVEVDGVSYGLKKGLKCYLMLGIDDPSTEGYKNGTTDHWGVLCDTIQLYVVDDSNKKYTVLQLSRDTMVEMDILNAYGKPVTTTKQQLTYAHTFTGDANINAKNVVNTVSRLLGGIEIDGYVSLMYGCIVPVNDALGGVSVKIEDDFSEVDPQMVQGSTVTLKGNQALYYLRYRKGIGEQTNTSRMKRQQIYLDAFTNKLKAEVKSRSSIINDLYNAAEPYMVSNMSSGTITNLVLRGTGYSKTATRTLSGSERPVTYATGNTHNELTVSQDSLDKTILELFYEPLD